MLAGAASSDMLRPVLPLTKVMKTSISRIFSATILASALAGPAWSATVPDKPWSYTTQRPASGWERPGFDDSKWKTGPGGFGQRSTPGSRVGTTWRTPDIWLRQTIDLKKLPAKPALYLYHDEDAEVFINGKPVASFKGYITEYKVAPLDAKSRASLKQGKNLIAVHCHQTGGGQAIDVHVIDADHIPQLPGPKAPEFPFKSALITKWGEQVAPDNAWREYPRPSLVRNGADGQPAWTNLNGQWDYAIVAGDADKPAAWQGKILVPFCPESKLSGVQRLLNPGQALWYRRSFDWKKSRGKRALLNFEAVDYACKVWLNGKEIGGHIGGNAPFQLDVASAIKTGSNELILRVEDATGGTQLRGKQRLDPRGIWYTRVSGIWQTVWLEEAPALRIDSLKVRTKIDGTVTVAINAEGKNKRLPQATAIATLKGKEAARTTGRFDALELKIPDPELWSPDSPTLYDLQVTLGDDTVHSYFGIREVGRERDKDGHLRFTLNGREIFHWGPLDQGWWPDGLLTPPSDEGMRWDIEWLKDAGFNMIRKHIKMEPRRYYYHCDKLGMMVWQDQVSAIKNPPWTRMKPNPKDADWTDDEHARYLAELKEMMDAFDPHPSIVVWVPFNEAWGQHRTVETGKWTMAYDPSRLVNIASGGNFWPVGHVADHHSYPHPDFPFDADRYDRDFIKVVGEFGGHGWPAIGHLWDSERDNWGYGGLPKNAEEYQERYRESLRRLVELKKKGIAGAVYTQTTDVEGEINGLLSYDRKVIKIPAKELKKICAPLFE